MCRRDRRMRDLAFVGQHPGTEQLYGAVCGRRTAATRPLHIYRNTVVRLHRQPHTSHLDHLRLDSLA